MDSKDVDLTPSTSFQKVSTLSTVDTDHDSNDIESVWQGVTISNQTDQAIYLKNTRKSSTPSGSGRKLEVGSSIYYATFDAKKCWMKAEGAIGSGKVILSGEQ